MRSILHLTSFRGCIIYASMMLKLVVATTNYYISTFDIRYLYLTVLPALYRLCTCVTTCSKLMIMICDQQLLKIKKKYFKMQFICQYIICHVNITYNVLVLTTKHALMLQATKLVLIILFIQLKIAKFQNYLQNN